MKWIPYILIALVPGSYYICELFFANDLTNWWYLRTALYSFQVGLAFFLLQNNTSDKNTEIIYFVFVAICAQDIADKIGKIYGYTWWDLIAIGLALIIAYRKYKSHIKELWHQKQKLKK